MVRPRSQVQTRELLPAAVLERIDQTCDRFEAEWLAGRDPRIEDFLGDASPADRLGLLRELLLLEIDYRRKVGQAIFAED